eukprot:TRINITY_DN24801_c0_g2_i1.p1 TRINITY_DN24801_c0_g2~~TRINITY_DN24801_c0_g2_i1.p1  ORF type:complete len:595 (-),score=74.31 TRINITY_DN24801_c0_g2_i1:157-1941(-)
MVLGDSFATPEASTAETNTLLEDSGTPEVRFQKLRIVKMGLLLAVAGGFCASWSFLGGTHAHGMAHVPSKPNERVLTGNGTAPAQLPESYPRLPHTWSPQSEPEDKLGGVMESWGESKLWKEAGGEGEASWAKIGEGIAAAGDFIEAVHAGFTVEGAADVFNGAATLVGMVNPVLGLGLGLIGAILSSGEPSPQQELYEAIMSNVDKVITSDLASRDVDNIKTSMRTLYSQYSGPLEIQSFTKGSNKHRYEQMRQFVLSEISNKAPTVMVPSCFTQSGKEYKPAECSAAMGSGIAVYQFMFLNLWVNMLVEMIALKPDEIKTIREEIGHVLSTYLPMVQHSYLVYYEKVSQVYSPSAVQFSCNRLAKQSIAEGVFNMEFQCVETCESLIDDSTVVAAIEKDGNCKMSSEHTSNDAVDGFSYCKFHLTKSEVPSLFASGEPLQLTPSQAANMVAGTCGANAFQDQQKSVQQSLQGTLGTPLESFWTVLMATAPDKYQSAWDAAHGQGSCKPEGWGCMAGAPPCCGKLFCDESKPWNNVKGSGTCGSDCKLQDWGCMAGAPPCCNGLVCDYSTPWTNDAGDVVQGSGLCKPGVDSE